jgi:uncharacterized protein (DUF302 family)
MTDTFSFEVKLVQPFEKAVEMVTQALKSEGFGVLTEINVQATLKKKLDKDFRPYVILGACNPPLAHQALASAPEIGLLLPCNVTVEATEDGGSMVRLLDPKIMVQVGEMAKNETLVNVANQANKKLKRVADALKN